MILKETKVVCVKCKKVLTVANPKGLRSAFCTCGICHSRIEVNFWVEDKNPATTPNVGGYGKETSLPPIREIKERTVSLLVEGREYTLALGNNIVGRWSPTSSADIQLLVHDDSLSRQHVMVNVYRLPDGNVRVTVKNLKNKNETLVNGKPLGDDNLVVRNGDKITMTGTMASVVIKE